MPYSPSDYWRELHRRDDLSAVGQSALPVGIIEGEAGRLLGRADGGRQTQAFGEEVDDPAVEVVDPAA